MTAQRLNGRRITYNVLKSGGSAENEVMDIVKERSSRLFGFLKAIGCKDLLDVVLEGL